MKICDAGGSQKRFQWWSATIGDLDSTLNSVCFHSEAAIKEVDSLNRSISRQVALHQYVRGGTLGQRSLGTLTGSLGKLCYKNSVSLFHNSAVDDYSLDFDILELIQRYG